MRGELRGLSEFKINELFVPMVAFKTAKRDASKYPQNMFSWRNKKIISILYVEKMPCLEL